MKEMSGVGVVGILGKGILFLTFSLHPIMSDIVVVVMLVVVFCITGNLGIFNSSHYIVTYAHTSNLPHIK